MSHCLAATARRMASAKKASPVAAVRGVGGDEDDDGGNEMGVAASEGPSPSPLNSGVVGCDAAAGLAAVSPSSSPSAPLERRRSICEGGGVVVGGWMSELCASFNRTE